ncbi:alpha/beta hydrolase [Actinospica sp. MGRD01-02]|uniref:Alpha/beta hydrolase n=1 Tax=Actinospica acidithermotolerans TaxID=2828514 RepID=A0A941EE80_9ACTN|nr:alpha/beta hydrolase [Actinospica acidithermotolerans]MBR7828847.1 alpha/beta hydrolase [Actinospica acidithermotolerans]
MSEVGRVNASGLKPVAFVHGLWLLPSSWQPWREMFEAAGYATLAPGWPDDPATVAEGRAHPELFARKRIKQVADHLQDVLERLNVRPALVGHSFGGLLVQQLAGRGIAAATVAIDPAPFRGVLPLPFPALKSAWPVIGNPANYRRSVMLTLEQFRYSFANELGANESQRLYDELVVPASGVPLFQAATANVNPFTEAKTDSRTPRRGPLLLITGEKDHIAAPAIAKAAYRKQKRNKAVTRYLEIPGRGHSLVFDHGWRDVADPALAFIKEHG